MGDPRQATHNNNQQKTKHSIKRQLDFHMCHWQLSEKKTVAEFCDFRAFETYSDDLQNGYTLIRYASNGVGVVSVWRRIVSTTYSTFWYNI